MKLTNRISMKSKKYNIIIKTFIFGFIVVFIIAIII